MMYAYWLPSKTAVDARFDFLQGVHAAKIVRSNVDDIGTFEPR